eukprot:s4134_g8.t1
MKSDHGCVHALLRILPDRKTIVATAKERRAAAEMAGIYSVSRLQARLLLHREHYPGIALITVVKQRDGAAAKEMGATYPDGHETRERDDPERLLNSFGGRVTNKDSADYTVPLISRDPEAAQFLRKYDIWISTWVIDLQALITAVKQRDGAAAKDLERLLNSFGGLVTNKVWWFLLWLRKSSRLPGAAEWCMQQVIGLKVCWLEI